MSGPDAQLLGIDYGGTSTKLVLSRVPVAGEAVDRTSAEFFTFDTPLVDDALGRLADEVAQRVSAPVAAAGVTVAGILDDATGVVVHSSNLPWLNGVDIGAALGERLGYPVRAVHDGRAGAAAEAVLGAGRGVDDIFVMALGTGIAGAIVRGGRVIPGAHGSAGEIGHVSQDPGGRECTCGQRGCLETFIGGAHLARRWSDVVGRDETARELVEAAGSGHPGAVALLEEATTALARGLLGMVATLDPGLIVVGGGLASSWDLVVAPAERRLRELATFHTIPRVVPAELGSWAGAWGAVLAADRVTAE